VPDYQETTVNIVHVPDKRAHVWTNNRGVKARMAHLGFEPTKRQNGGYWYNIPARCIWFKSPKKRTLSEAQRENLRKNGISFATRRKIGAKNPLSGTHEG